MQARVEALFSHLAEEVDDALADPALAHGAGKVKVVGEHLRRRAQRGGCRRRGEVRRGDREDAARTLDAIGVVPTIR